MVAASILVGGFRRGIDDDLPPTHQNRIPRGGGRLAGNGRSAVGLIPYPRMYGDVDMEAQIHQLEQEAYSSVLQAVKAQDDAITWEKASLITELKKELRLSNEEHRELLSQVNADDVILRIREWRQVGGHQPGVGSTGPALHDSNPSPTALHDMEAQIHQLEQEAYSSVLLAFKAQADAITWEKESLITELKKELRLSNEKHRELLSRVNADDVIRRIREWRQAGGHQPGVGSTGPALHDSNPSPTVSAPHKKAKIMPSGATRSLGVPSSSIHPQPLTTPHQPSSGSKRGSVPGSKGKKQKPYCVFLALLVIVELGSAAFIFFTHNWEKKVIPKDASGRFNSVYDFMHVHWSALRWIDLAVFVLQVIAMILALYLRSVFKRDEKIEHLPRVRPSK